MSIKEISESDLVYIALQTLQGKFDANGRDWTKINPEQEASAFITDMGKSPNPSLLQISDKHTVSRIQSAFSKAFDAIQFQELCGNPSRILNHPQLAPEESRRIEEVLGGRVRVQRFLGEFIDELDTQVDDRDIVGQSELYRSLPACLRQNQDLLDAEKRFNESKIETFTLIALNQLRSQEGQGLPIDYATEFKLFIQKNEIPNERISKLAFERAFKFHQIMKVLSDPMANTSFLSPDNRRIAALFPHFYKEYIVAFETAAKATLAPSDFQGHIDLFNDFANRLNRDHSALERGMSYLTRGMSESDFRVATAMHRLKHDPRIKEGTIPDWEFLKQNYPDLVKVVFTSNPKQKYLETVKDPNQWFPQFISCFREQDQISARYNLRNIGFIEDLIQNPLDDLTQTSLYRYLSQELCMTPNEIDRVLLAAEQNLPDPSKNAAERRQQAMVFLAAHLSIFEKHQRFYSNTFQELSPAEITGAIRCYNGDKFNSYEDQVAAQIPFIQIGHRMTEYLDENPQQWFWFPALLTSNQQQIIWQREEWIPRASMAFEDVFADTIQNKDPAHPLDVHREISELVRKKVQMQLGTRVVMVTRQFPKDADRYELLFLSPKKGQAVKFPGKMTTKAAIPKLVQSLNKMAGEDKELSYLLQEMTTQNPQKMAVAQWLYPELDKRTKSPKISGFIGIMPFFRAIAIERDEDNDQYNVEYDVELNTLNTHMALRKGPLPPGYNTKKSYSVRIRYQIKRDPITREWTVQTPEWIGNRADLTPLKDRYKQILEVSDASELSTKDRLARLPSRPGNAKFEATDAGLKLSALAPPILRRIEADETAESADS